MDKPSSHNQTGSLQVNGPLSPPLTPAVNGTGNRTDILDGTNKSFLGGRPASPDPSISSRSGSSSNNASSTASSPRPRSASTFTAPPSTYTQPSSTPDLRLLEDSTPQLPNRSLLEAEHKGHATPQAPQAAAAAAAAAAVTATTASSQQKQQQAPGWRKRRVYTDGRQDAPFPRLSKPVELLRGAYDVVVIGSGYGGGVAASRMARTGQSVCVLERGREKWPGEYPRGTADAVRELHCSGAFAPGWLKGLPIDAGDPTGLFHLIMGRGQSAVVANGLGGTSLINANVFMEADKETLAMKAWPPEIRENVDELDKYYAKVEAVLEPQEYPDEWPKLAKAELFKKQAELLGLGHKFKKVRQTTRFTNGPNSCGVEMSPSTLTGQDTTGINDGSKNSTLVTYIADAWNWGAEIFCECEVRYIEKVEHDEGYRVYFAWHGRNRGLFKANLHGDLMWVHAKKAVFLGAGAIASTEILLRSKAMGLEMSDLVGQNMSGNGDMLAFGYNADEKTNILGSEKPSPYDPTGPTITSVIDCREGNENPLNGFVIEEGAIPHALAPFFQAMLDLMPGKKESENETLFEKTQAALARYGSRVLGPYFKKGAVEKTQVYLVMSHDSSQAVLSLVDDKPMLEFTGFCRSHHVKRLNQLLEKATEAVGGTLVHNPFQAVLDQQITVHPIGGACMARDNTGKTGVTNHAGQVFRGRGSETYDGLIVTDGSVIPTALGANPFATIAALAERSVEMYAKSKGLTISEEKNGILDLLGEPQHAPRRDRPSHKREQIRMMEEQESLDMADKVIRSARELSAGGIGFTEVMSGFIHHDENLTGDDRETYELAHRVAKSRCESARFFLSVQAFNTRELVRHSQHRGMLTGTFVCPAIPGSPFMVQRGEFNLFILNNKAPGTRNLTYDFDMTGVDGRRLHFHGYKVVDSSVALAPFEFWRATSTLYVTVSKHVKGMCADLDDEDAWRRGPVVAKGVMHIRPADFLSQIETMAPTGSNVVRRALSAASFLTYFTRKSLSLLLAPLTPLEYPTKTCSGYINHTPPDRSVDIVAPDGLCSRMHVWEPTHVPEDSGVRNLFMIPGASVDHQIFALPTIPFNAVNYFTRAGYRVLVSVHRISQLMMAGSHWTTYDARLDLRACLEHIRAAYGPEPVYAVAHCMGSVAFASGLLDGTIPASWILGITCSQVFMHPVWSPTNMAKVLAGPVPLDRLYSLVAGSWFSCGASPPGDAAWPQRALDQLLRLYPQPRREMCSSASCHRTSLVFGRCWNHANLNEATHRQIDRFFGGVNMTQLRLLMRMGRDGHVMANAPLFERLTGPDNVARLRGLPVFLFVGRDNAVLSPESTVRSYEVLCDAFERGDYRRRVVPGYGHLDCWMGRNAWKDVYPLVREEVDRVTRGEHYEFVEPDDRFKAMVHGGELLY
ncbi:FAD/NAD(P)-binding domain-containing protein [Thermothelomyces heterothallicus CBS 203.75]